MPSSSLLDRPEEKLPTWLEKISALCSSALRNSQFELQLRQATTPAQFIETAISHGHEIDLDDLATFLTLYKSDPKCVTINDMTGDSICIANCGRFPIGPLMLLFEEHGLVRPFCNLDGSKEEHTIYGMPTDINKKVLRGKKLVYSSRQCFLPRGYFLRLEQMV